MAYSDTSVLVRSVCPGVWQWAWPAPAEGKGLICSLIMLASSVKGMASMCGPLISLGSFSPLELLTLSVKCRPLEFPGTHDACIRWASLCRSSQWCTINTHYWRRETSRGDLCCCGVIGCCVSRIGVKTGLTNWLKGQFKQLHPFFLGGGRGDSFIWCIFPCIS